MRYRGASSVTFSRAIADGDKETRDRTSIIGIGIRAGAGRFKVSTSKTQLCSVLPDFQSESITNTRYIDPARSIVFSRLTV